MNFESIPGAKFERMMMNTSLRKQRLKRGEGGAGGAGVEIDSLRFRNFQNFDAAAVYQQHCCLEQWTAEA